MNSIVNDYYYYYNWICNIYQIIVCYSNNVDINFFVSILMIDLMIDSDKDKNKVLVTQNFVKIQLTNYLLDTHVT